MKRKLLSVGFIFILVLTCVALPAMAAEETAADAHKHAQAAAPEGRQCGGCFGYDTYDDYRNIGGVLRLVTLCNYCTYITMYY